MDIGSISSSGIKAALLNMESISNNIANVNTTGYKKSAVNFSDVFAGNNGNAAQQIGMGVRTSSVAYDFSPGTMRSSSNGLHLALPKDGFFIQKNPVTGLVSYTRAGEFQFDSHGNLTGKNGIVQGFPAYNGVVTATGSLVNLAFPTTPLPPKPTTQVNFSVNLNAKSDAITTPLNINDPTTYHFSSNTTIYDSLGNPSTMSLYYVKTADNAWTASAAIGDQIVGSGTLDFDGSGNLVSSSGLNSFSWTPGNGAISPQTINLNMTGSTQYNDANSTRDRTQNGMVSGTPQSCSIDSNGYVNIYYSNNMNVVQGQIAVAKFPAPQGLEKGDNLSWIPTNESGSPLVNQQSSFGAFMVNALESSNVDLTEELVKLIGAQHHFQANAQVQQTYNQVMQTIEKL